MSEPYYEEIGRRTIYLIEECAELIHILCKAERFGVDNWHPNDSEKTPNRELIAKEMRDVEKRIKELRAQLLIVDTGEQVDE